MKKQKKSEKLKTVLLVVVVLLAIAAIVTVFILLPPIVKRILLWVLLAILGIFILFLLLPTSVQIEYRAQKFTLKVRVFFIKIKIFPLKELTEEQKQAKEEKKQLQQEKKKLRAEKKKQKNADDETEETQQEEEKKEKPKRSIEEWILLIQQIAGSVTKGGKFFFKHLHFKDVEFVMPIYDESAASIALKYGAAQSIVGGLYATLQNFVKISFKRIQIIPDFVNQYKEETTFACKLEASPIIIIIAGIIGVKRFFAYRKQKKENYRIMAKQIVEERKAKRARYLNKKKEEQPQQQPTGENTSKEDR